MKGKRIGLLPGESRCQRRQGCVDLPFQRLGSATVVEHVRRLARLLLLLANFGKEGSPQPITPNISQETLAEMIGTTRSRVSYFMNKFRKLGLISYNGKIEVHNSLLSAVLHEKPEIERDDSTGKV